MISVMKSMNNTVGTKLEYWGCHMKSTKSVAYKSKASELRNLGLTTVNVNIGLKDAMNNVKSGGFALSVFTWGSFNKDQITTYTGSPYNAKYMMTDKVNVN